MNVSTTDLARRFGRTTAVAGVTLDADTGVYGLLGPNGAGKTSLLRMLATVSTPSSGRMELFGNDPGISGSGGRSAASSATCHRAWASTPPHWSADTARSSRRQRGGDSASCVKVRPPDGPAVGAFGCLDEVPQAARTSGSRSRPVRPDR